MINICIQKRDEYWYGIAIQDDRVLIIHFSSERINSNHLLRKLPKNAVIQLFEEPDQFFEKIINRLVEIINGNNRESERFKLDMTNVSSYAEKVLNCTQLIPVGFVTTYGKIAKVVGGSPRAVGRVEASNPFPLLIPCHRVVRSDLSIGGYGCGEHTKMDILLRERRAYKKSKKIIVNNKELYLFPAEWVQGYR